MTKEELKQEAEKWVENNLHSTEEDYIKAFKDGDCCCDKTKEEIENDIEVYQECMRKEEELLAEEMEKQLIANYDFERGDVKY